MMSKLLKGLLPILLFCAFSHIALPVIAAEVPEETKVTTTYPGLDQVVPRSSSLAAEAGEAVPSLTIEDTLGRFQDQIIELESLRTELTKQLDSWGDINTWPLNRLLDARTRLIDLRKKSRDLMNRIAQPMKNLETLRALWMEKQVFWAGWEESLKQQGTTVPVETFSQVQNTIREITDRTTKATNLFIELQQKVSNAQEASVTWLSQVETILSGIRKVTFKRNAYPLISNNYINQFNSDLLSETRLNLWTALAISPTFFQVQGWVGVIQVVVFVLISVLLFAKARRKDPITEEWQFLFRHPWAAGIFISLLSTSVLYSSPPAFLQLILVICGASAAVILIYSELKNPRLKGIVLTLAVLFVLSEVFKIIGLPTPFYRLYLAFICLSVIPVFLLSALREVKSSQGKMTTAALCLYLGSFVAGVGLLTQIIGFSTFTTNLVDAALGTVFVLLVAQMALHLGNGGIIEILKTDWIKSRVFVKRLGRHTERRLKEILKIFIIGYTTVYLLYVWNLFPSLSDAWATVLEWSIELGDFNVSFGMVLLAIATLYSTLVFSWVFQAFLDSQILTPQRKDRGVKEAIKKLTHYSFVLAGFLLAISVAGVGLEKFAILAGALGVGIGFGLQNIVNNFISGLILLFERPIKVGDTINIDDQWGKITRIGLRSTVFETLDYAEIIVPNSELISQKVTNWTFSSNVSRVVLIVGVAYGSPLDKVLAILNRVATEHTDILDDPEPSAIFTGFGSSSIDFELRVWISDISKRLKVKSELGQAIDHNFKEENITIPFPQRDLHLKSIDGQVQTVLANDDKHD